MIRIKIPFKTPTINHLYGHRGPFKYIKKEARELREEINLIVKKSIKEEGCFIAETNNIEVKVEIYENWYTKKGDVKKKDIANREKFLIDSIFNSIGVDDKGIFKHTMIKKQSEKEYAIITIK